MFDELAPENLLGAYAAGYFPMADDGGTIHWLAPEPRAIIELHDFRVSRSLRAVLRRGTFETTFNEAFKEVMSACADRPEGTWISRKLLKAYCLLHRLGFAHSVESWKDGALAGGLYGVALGGVFFGESMFYHVTDASKVALAALVRRMRERDFVLLDVQFITQHLGRLGAREIPREAYERRLHQAIRLPRSLVDRSDR